MRQVSYILAAVIAGFALSAAPARADGPFRKLAYAQALAEAAKEKKLVFIDFYTTWCAPCKTMDRTTFEDAWVVKWLGDRAVSLRVDAERDVALAEKFQVEFYPTLVFLNGEGKILERLFGYVSADEFRKAARDLHKGVTALDRTKQALAKQPDNPHLRLDLAAAQVRKNQYAEALRELLWCLDHGVKQDATFARVRDTRLLDELLMLGEMYEPARSELARRRDAAERRMLDDRPAPADAALYAGVCLLSMDAQRLLATYDAVAARGARSPTAQALFKHAFPVLLEAKRYEDIVAGADLAARLDEIFREGREALADLDRQATNPNDAQRTLAKARAVAQATQYFQVLLALQRVDAARALARRVLEFDNAPDAYHALAWEGYLSRKPIPECLDYAKVALDRAEADEKANATDTVARVMYALGRTDEAIALCEETLAKVDNDRDRWILSNCLADLRGLTAHSG